ncbi:BTB/POZ protein [Staphylotrichum tortipilum]|uniref:BTB/POZ protein n=1 Tax=Staphylotrichum tortipilum TaxID=2831512 RepID=A0AAN6RTQ5_9PEZI|nr:BTB/POZ protein [Staphylotrichum longicolle]
MSAANDEATTAEHVCSVSTNRSDSDEDYDSLADDLPTPSIYAGLSALLGSEKFSDMSIRCGGREFKAHRAIVCAQSRFFDRALTGGFTEAATGVVDLPEDDPAVLERFLQFLYTGTYTDVAGSASGPPSDACKLSPEEVQDQLDRGPGVHTVCPADEESDAEPPDYNEEGGSEAELSDTTPAEPNEPPEEYESESFNDELSDAAEGPPGYPAHYNHLSTRLRQLATAFDTEEKARQIHLDSHVQMELELFLPVRLYVMADKFDVPALKLLARDRFYRAAELSWRVADCFPEVVDELYTNTAPTDLALREIVCRLVGASIKDAEQRGRMEEVMKKHGDFAVGVMNYMLLSEQRTWS